MYIGGRNKQWKNSIPKEQLNCMIENYLLQVDDLKRGKREYLQCISDVTQQIKSIKNNTTWET